MKCPRHQTDLDRKAMEHQEIDRCPECEGIWIPGPAIDKVLGKGELLKLRSLCSVRESDLLCPADSRRLYEGKIGPVTVDLCPHCHGLWLDPGELESLLQRRPITPHVNRETGTGFAPAESSLTTEVVLFGLLGLM